jgi:hypothetical protein
MISSHSTQEILELFKTLLRLEQHYAPGSIFCPDILEVNVLLLLQAIN